MAQDLLEEISKASGCTYLSDLKFSIGTNAFVKGIQSVSKAVFPLSEWNECVFYLLEENIKFSSEQEARNHLMQAKAKSQTTLE